MNPQGRKLVRAVTAFGDVNKQYKIDDNKFSQYVNNVMQQ